MTVKAQGSPQVLCDFLYEFYHSGLLHKIVSMDLTSPKHESNAPIEMTLAIEGLSLLSSPPRKTLFAEAPEAVAAFAPPLRPRSDYAEIGSKSYFVRRYNGPPTPTADPSKSAPPPVDTAKDFYLVASLAHGKVRDAWLYDKKTKTRSVLTEGSPFNVAGVSGFVSEVHANSVSLKIKDDAWLLKLGQNLREMTKVVPEMAPATAK